MGLVFANYFLFVFNTHTYAQKSNEQPYGPTVTLGESSIIFESMHKGKIKQLSLL